LECVPNSEFGHNGFAAASRGSHHNGITTQEGGNSLPLEVIQGEWIHGIELIDGGSDRVIIIMIVVINVCLGRMSVRNAHVNSTHGADSIISLRTITSYQRKV